MQEKPYERFTGNPCAACDVKIGQWLSVWWPTEAAWFTGTVVELKTEHEATMSQIQHKVSYLDEDELWHTLDVENFQLGHSESNCLKLADELSAPDGSVAKNKQVVKAAMSNELSKGKSKGLTKRYDALLAAVASVRLSQLPSRNREVDLGDVFAERVLMRLQALLGGSFNHECRRGSS